MTVAAADSGAGLNCFSPTFISCDTRDHDMNNDKGKMKSSPASKDHSFVEKYKEILEGKINCRNFSITST